MIPIVSSNFFQPFNRPASSLESKSAEFCMTKIMTLIHPIISASKNCLLRFVASKDSEDLLICFNFLSDFPEKPLLEPFLAESGFYGYFFDLIAVEPLNEASDALSQSMYMSKNIGGTFTPTCHIFGSFAHSSCSKLKTLFNNFCMPLLASISPSWPINFSTLLEDESIQLSLDPWQGQRMYKKTSDEPKYISVLLDGSVSVQNAGSVPMLPLQKNTLIVQQTSHSSSTFAPFSLPLPTTLFDFFCAGPTRTSSPIFLQPYVEKSEGLFIRQTQLDSSTVAAPIDVVLSCINDFLSSDQTFLPGIFSSPTSLLFEIGASPNFDLVLGLNLTAFKKSHPDIRQLKLLAADFLDRYLDLNSSLFTKVLLAPPKGIENMEFCHACTHYGELLCCDECPRSFCIPCSGLSKLPTSSSWSCAICAPPKPFLSAAVSASVPAASSSSSFKKPIPRVLKVAAPVAAHVVASPIAADPFSDSGYQDYALLDAAAAAANLSTNFDEMWGLEDSINLGLSGPSALSGPSGLSGFSGGASSAESNAAAAFMDHHESLSGLLLAEDTSSKSKKRRLDSSFGGASFGSGGGYNTFYYAFREILDNPGMYPTDQVRSFQSTSSMPDLEIPFFNGIKASRLDSSQPYDHEWLSSKIANNSNHFAKPPPGATRGGHFRVTESKIPFLIRDLNLCAQIGFSPMDIFNIFSAKDEKPAKIKIFLK